MAGKSLIGTLLPHIYFQMLRMGVGLPVVIGLHLSLDLASIVRARKVGSHLVQQQQNGQNWTRSSGGNSSGIYPAVYVGLGTDEFELKSSNSMLDYSMEFFFNPHIIYFCSAARDSLFFFLQLV